jgi:hypothetical protein
MTDLTILMTTEQHRVAREAYHPSRAMAHELALSRRGEPGARWWRRSFRAWLAPGRQVARCQGC